jgi:hypothetical protein
LYVKKEEKKNTFTSSKKKKKKKKRTVACRSEQGHKGEAESTVEVPIKSLNHDECVSIDMGTH